MKTKTVFQPRNFAELSNLLSRPWLVPNLLPGDRQYWLEFTRQLTALHAGDEEAAAAANAARAEAPRQEFAARIAKNASGAPRWIDMTNTTAVTASLASADRRTASPFRLACAMTATGPSADRQVPEGLVDSCPLCTRHVVGVRHKSGPFPSLWAQPKTRLQRRFTSGESRDQAGT